MTKKELIEQLEPFDDDTDVCMGVEASVYDTYKVGWFKEYNDKVSIIIMEDGYPE